MEFQIIFFISCGIEISSQLTGNICFHPIRPDQIYCCANFENINGVCTNCRKGTSTNDEGRCVPCLNDSYGYKCIHKCACDQFQRCDPDVGCVQKTSIRTIHTSYRGSIEPVTPPKDKVNAKEATVTKNGTIEQVSPSNDKATTKDTTNIMSGTSNTEWIIYTLCITGCFFLTGFGHLLRTYRKRNALGVGKVNEDETLQPLELASYINDIYDDVDENTLTFVTMGSNVTCQASHNEPINFVFDDRQSDVADYEDGEAGYFDLYFGMNDCTNQQGENRALQKESPLTSSSDSNVVSKDNTEYSNPYIPLQEHYQNNTHVCEVAITVHQRIESSSGSDEEDISNFNSNLCKSLQKDRHVNSQGNENRQDIETKYDATLQTALPLVSRTGYFHDHLNKYIYAASDSKIDNCGEMESVKDKVLEKNIPKTL